MHRYQLADDDVVSKIADIIKTDFPYLEGANICTLFDTKKRMRERRIVLASIKATNNFEAFLSSYMSGGSGYDYFIFIDHLLWTNVIDSEDDRTRLIRHELKHAYVVQTDDGPVFKTGPHEIEDFYSEQSRNQDAKEWKERLAASLFRRYEQIKDKQRKLF